MKKQFMRLAVVLIALTALAGTARAAQIELTFGHIQHPGHDLYKAPEHFKKLVEERTGGRVTVSTFPSSQLGTEREMAEQCIMGTLDITFGPISSWASVLNVPVLAVFELPFLYDSLETQKRVIDGMLATECEALLKGTGVRLLLTYSNGIRSPILKNKPIHTLDDLKGVKMRCAEIPLYVQTWSHLGCNIVTSPWSEVYTVVSQGVADAAEADAVGLVNVNLHEVCKYFSKIAQMGNVYAACINEDTWNRLPDDLRKIVAECAAESAAEQMRGRKQSDDEAERVMAAAGVKINDIAPAERARMREAVKPIYDEYANKYSAHDLIARLLKMTE